jgi:hypothetical protein
MSAGIGGVKKFLTISTFRLNPRLLSTAKLPRILIFFMVQNLLDIIIRFQIQMISSSNIRYHSDYRLCVTAAAPIPRS